MSKRIALIVGAGPAGLTAGYELLDRTDIKPIIFEQTQDIGGISKTVNYKGNYIDIGGHRFFTKSDRVMEWWLKIIPLENSPCKGMKPSVQHSKSLVEPGEDNPDPDKSDLIMLIRSRLSRILYRRSFYNYPISISLATVKNLGIIHMARILFSYIYAVLFPIN